MFYRVEDVYSRIEIPSNNSRWDSPLFTIKSPQDNLPMKDIVFSILGFKDKPRQENLEIPVCCHVTLFAI